METHWLGSARAIGVQTRAFCPSLSSVFLRCARAHTCVCRFSCVCACVCVCVRPHGIIVSCTLSAATATRTHLWWGISAGGMWWHAVGRPGAVLHGWPRACASGVPRSHPALSLALTRMLLVGVGRRAPALSREEQWLSPCPGV